MKIYKITNVTDTFGKRTPKFNSNVEYKIVNGIVPQKQIIKPGETIFLKVKDNLPVDLLKADKEELVIIAETTEYELNRFNKKPEVTIKVDSQPDIIEKKQGEYRKPKKKESNIENNLE